MSARERRLAATFDALAAVRWRLESSLGEDRRYFPVDAEGASSRDPDATRVLDAFLQRFNQLLDQILRKLFPRLHATIAADDELLPIKQLFDVLHRASVIDDVDAWQELVEVRNRLTHDYALDAVERAAALNDAWKRAPALLAQIDRAWDYVERHRLLKDDER